MTVPETSDATISSAPRHGRFLLLASLRTILLRFAGMAASFFLGVLLARQLGPDGFGIYGIAIALAVTLASIAQSGLPTLVTREVAIAVERADWSLLRGIAKWSGLFVAGVSVVIAAGTIGIGLIWPNALIIDARDLLLAVLLIAPLALTTLVSAELRAIGRVVAGQSLEILVRPSVTLALCLIILLAAGQLTPTAALASNFGASLVALAGAMLWLRRSMPSPVRVAAPVYHPRPWLTAALPLALVDAFRQIDANYAILIVGVLAADQEAGLLRVAVSMIVVIATPLSIANVVLAPTLARLNEAREHQELQSLMALTALIMTAAMIFTLALIILAGQPLLVAVFGPAYAGSWLPLVVLTVAQLINGIFGVGWVFLTMAGGERPLTLSFMVSVPVSIVAAIAAIPIAGATGAAAAAIAGALLQNLIIWRYLRRHCGLDCSVLGAIPGLRPKYGLMGGTL